MGFASGFQVGAQAVERGLKMREEDRLKEQLAEAYKAPTSGFGYTSADMAEMRRMQGLGDAYNIEAVPGSEGGTPTLRYTPTGLNLGSGDMPEASTNFAPQQIQRYGDQAVAGQFSPAQIRGLQAQAAARAVGASGDYRGAALLQQQAEEAEFNAKYRPLQLQSMEGQIASQAQQRDLTGIQIKGAKRVEAEAEQATNFAAFAAENPNATTQELKDAAFKQFKFTPDQWRKTVNTRLGIKEDEQKDFVLNIKDKLKGKNLTQLGTLYNTDPDFDDKTDLAIVPGKGGAVTLNFIDKATQRITGTQTFKNEAMATEYLNRQATEPETIGSWMLNLGKTEAAIAASKAASAASTSTSGLNAIRGNLVNRQIKDLDELAANTKEAKKLMTDFAALTEAEQNGPKGRALEKQYNMLVAKPGAQLRVSPEGKAPKAMDEVEKAQLEAYNKWLVEPRNARLPGGEKDAMAEQMGVSHLLRTVRERAAQSAGGVSLGANPYEGSPAPAPAAPASAQGLTKTSSAPALNTGNTKLLGRAGNTGYSVEMPDGTTRVMSISELNKLGYQFLGGNTGLERPWYDDLLPRR
jgi:hypothetical protein